MTCQGCGKHEAQVHLKQVFNGLVQELHLCADCARQAGYEDKNPLSIAELFMGLDARDPIAPASCPGCGLTETDLRKEQRMGCPRCYETFADEIRPMLESMQGALTHTGKCPARQRAAVELAGLREALRRAVEAQAFEDAARLRDRIRALEGDGVATRPA